MKYFIQTALLILLACFVASTTAHADVHIHVKNCTKLDLEFNTYNGHDKVAHWHYKQFTLKRLEEGKTDTVAKKTSCKIGCGWGQTCKSRCKLRVQSDVGGESNTVNVYKGQYIRFLRAQIITSGDGHTRTWYTRSSKEQKCSDPAPDIKQLD